MNLLDLARSAVADRPANDPEARYFRWRVAIPGRVFEVRTAPEMTVAKVRALYRGAEVEPMPDTPKRKATEAEAAELRALVGRVLVDAPHEQADVLARALADPEAALESFRRLADDR